MGPDKMCLMLADHLIDTYTIYGTDNETKRWVADRYEVAYSIQHWIEAHERADDPEEIVDGTVF